jgi:alpha-amylase/alpha-mannosidase (GH57 family)
MKKKSNRFLCIHGHFYQPPRENPWTGTIHIQKSAYPYHDWNERITRECYGPNTRSRLHGDNGYIKKLVNNYEYISFNYGPTLLSWMEKNNPWIYSQIIEADKKSCETFGGHGNAIAQVYNHIIMPLATEKDKITQVKWGLADFSHRFGRKAEGMWLAETAVNKETLRVMAMEGVRFTILSPFQAHMVRDISHDKSEWQDVSGGRVDYLRPYRCFLTEDRSLYIDIFFYNGPLSKAIAYEKLLGSGEVFLRKIIEAYPSEINTPALVSMATDGESYGHHFKFGEMALTWVLDTVKHQDDITLTNYGEFLEKYPPENEIKIIENSAWSCAHGIERWRSNCGCSVSQHPGWTQSWRTPLRDGLDWLNVQLSTIFEKESKGLLKNCWEARNSYISVILNPDEDEKNKFIQRHSLKPLTEKEKIKIFRLLESQKFALFMFTSCGWFFDDISGLEAVQILMYAKKAIDLFEAFSHEDLEKGLMDYLKKAVSNDQKYMNGLEVYNKKVLPLKYNMASLSANYAMLCVMDQNHGLEWLKNIVNPCNEKRGIAGGNTIYYFETDDPDILDKDFKICCVSVETIDNELKCISGKTSKDNQKLIEEMIEGILSSNGQILNLDTFSKYLFDSNTFTMEDMMPDVRSEIVDILSTGLENRFFGTVYERPQEMYTYIKYLTSADKNLPDNLVNSVQSIANDLFMKLFKYSGDTPINYNEIEYLLSLFEKESDDEESISINRIVFDPVCLLQQDRIVKSIERFLKRQIALIRENNINLYLNNILNSLVFIQKYKLNPDLWQFQNLFDDLRSDMDFIKNMDQDSLSLFRQIEKLLGFTGGNQYA